MIYLMARGGLIKASALILFPGLGAAKARMLGRAGFINVVLLVCVVVGICFTYFNYAASHSA